MAYLQHIPRAPLNAYIDDMYYLDGPAPYARLRLVNFRLIDGLP